MDAPIVDPTTTGTIERPLESGLIEIRKLDKVYESRAGRQTVFKDLSASIGSGEFVSIVGPSGCGKSTFLKLISGLESPTSGETAFAGQQVTGPPQGMIYVFQQYSKSIFPWKTVQENIKFGLCGKKGVSKAEAEEACREYVDILGLNGFENYYPYQLSGGMQQRVCIARALMCKPAVLLMDEPFSAVDAMTRAILQELLLKIWRTLPITIVFVTHDLDEAVFMSTRIISLGRNGAGIVEDLEIDLPTPRDAITTRGDPNFSALRQTLFSSIFAQEKAIAPGSH